jgi:hypothetical protein
MPWRALTIIGVAQDDPMLRLGNALVNSLPLLGHNRIPHECQMKDAPAGGSG